MKDYISTRKYLFYVRYLSFAHLFVCSIVKNQKLSLLWKEDMEQLSSEGPQRGSLLVPSRHAQKHSLTSPGSTSAGEAFWE